MIQEQKSKEQIFDEEVRHQWNGISLAPSLCSMILSAMEEYAQQREQPWVRVEDGLPLDSESILFYSGNIYIGYFHLGFNRFMYDEAEKDEFPRGVTHWMPLPASPKD